MLFLGTQECLPSLALKERLVLVPLLLAPFLAFQRERKREGEREREGGEGWSGGRVGRWEVVLLLTLSPH